MKTLNLFIYFLLAVAGINWGLVGLFEFNLVEFLFRSYNIDRVVYVVVGICGLYNLFRWKTACKHKK